MATESETLADGLPRAIARVRDDVLPAYEALAGIPNVMVGPAIAMMKQAMDEAAKASAAGDTVAMLKWYHELESFSV